MRKEQAWNGFVSLAWYDAFIEFLFKFVAKTSEPLLAMGLVVSAADLLTKGALMRDNPTLTFAWAWAQAIAIEASSGVVFVYALQSFKSRDKLKGWLYLILSVLLAITGGAMLLLQLVANITGAGENTLPASVVYGLAILRVVVSIGYVFMCRAKHIRFTDLAEVKHPVSPVPQAEASAGISEETVQLILSKLAKLDALEQRLVQPVLVSEEKAEPLQIAAPASDAQNTLANGAKICDKEDEQPIFLERFQSKEQVIAAILQRTPGANAEQVAQEAGCSQRTATKWIQRLQETGAEQKESE